MNKFSIIILSLLSTLFYQDNNEEIKAELIHEGIFDVQKTTPLATNFDTARTEHNESNDSLIKKYTKHQILNMIVGTYENEEGAFKCKFKLTLSKKNNKLKYRIETDKRKISGMAKIAIEKEGYVYILFPIEWDDYQGDMTLETYEKYVGEKPQLVDMSFDSKERTLHFQNYGNAMNNYIIFDECDEKQIQLKLN